MHRATHLSPLTRTHVTRATAPRTIAPRHSAALGHDLLRVWFSTLALLVLTIVIVGGATRLTGSGLSITEWNLIGGVLPPLTDAQWQVALEKYRAIPQYQVINRGMSLEAFKTIFWWEWGHRMLGRLIGLVALVPLVVFSINGTLQGKIRTYAAVIFLGIVGQGILGWWMVKSGLTERTDVSQYRLMAHLCLAFAILGLIVWTLADLGSDRAHSSGDDVALKTISVRQRALGLLLVPLVFLQIAAGALVAGMKAGLMFNTWPLMGDTFVPTGLAAMEPFWRNLFENATTVQFNHRTLGIVVATLVLAHMVIVVRHADDGRVRQTAIVLGLLVTAQFALGVWTLVAGVPLALGLGHQLLAAVLLCAAVWHAHGLLRR